MLADVGSRHDSVLVGQYFHCLKEENGRTVVYGQGQVVEQFADKYYLVRLDWLVGTGSIQHIVTLEEMLGWQFYENAKDMRKWFRESRKQPK